MHVGHRRRPARARRPRRRPPSTWRSATSSVSTNGLPQNAYRWRVVSARLRAAEGDLDGALALLDEAERVYDGDFSPDVRPVARVAGPAVDPPRRARGGARLGARTRPVRRRRACPTCASSSTSPWPGCCSPRAGPRNGALDAATGPARAAARRGRGRRTDGQRHRGPRAAGLAPSSRAATRRRRSTTCGERSCWPSPRATCACSPTRARRRRPARASWPKRAAAATSVPASPGHRAPPTSPLPRAQPLVDPLSERELDVLRLLGSRPRRSGHRPRAVGLAEHRADPHEEHLRQARRRQPPGRGPPGRRGRAADGARGRLTPSGKFTSPLTTCGDVRLTTSAPSLPAMSSTDCPSR